MPAKVPTDKHGAQTAPIPGAGVAADCWSSFPTGWTREHRRHTNTFEIHHRTPDLAGTRFKSLNVYQEVRPYFDGFESQVYDGKIALGRGALGIVRLRGSVLASLSLPGKSRSELT